MKENVWYGNSHQPVYLMAPTIKRIQANQFLYCITTDNWVRQSTYPFGFPPLLLGCSV